MGYSVKQIREKVQITSVLSELGYDVQEDDREQQYCCDLHGTQDNKPSARVYPDSNSTYCWACGRSRDVFATVMDKLDMDFKGAVYWLGKTYGLTQYADNREQPTDTLDDHLKQSFSAPTENYEKQVTMLLEAQRFDKVLDFETVMSLWAQYDEIQHQAEQKGPAWVAEQTQALRTDTYEKVRNAVRIS